MRGKEEDRWKAMRMSLPCYKKVKESQWVAKRGNSSSQVWRESDIEPVDSIQTASSRKQSSQKTPTHPTLFSSRSPPMASQGSSHPHVVQGNIMVEEWGRRRRIGSSEK